MAGNNIFTSQYNTPIGHVTMASDGVALIGLWINGQKHFMAGIPSNAMRRDDLQIFVRTRKWLDEYFLGHNPSISDLDLAPMGTDFQRAVWNELCKIPYGQTITYGDIARRIGAFPRAVGSAAGHNRISVIIPCHRVVGANGAITGYAAGINTKIKLLQHEGAKL